MLGEFCRGLVGERACRANFFPYTRTVASYHRRRGALHAGNRGGFALHEALWLRVAGVSEAWMASFPHVVAVRLRFEAKVQTHWVKTLTTNSCGKVGLRFGRTGDVGFSGSLLGVRSGVVGFNVVTLSRSGPGGWALLLAVLTLQCAAKPHWWHGGQPAQTTTCWVNVRGGWLR